MSLLPPLKWFAPCVCCKHFKKRWEIKVVAKKVRGGTIELNIRRNGPRSFEKVSETKIIGHEKDMLLIRRGWPLGLLSVLINN